jgi:hypothetical protein
MPDQKDYDESMIELSKSSYIPLEVRRKMDVDRLRAEFEDAVQRIGRYCYDFCKKAPLGEYPAVPEKCPYDHCPLYKYRMGKP